MVNLENMSGEFPKFIRKRDGTIVFFDLEKITNAIFKAAEAIGGEDENLAEQLAKETAKKAREQYGNTVSVEQMNDTVESILKEKGHDRTYASFKTYRQRRTKAREVLSISKTIEGQRNLTDLSLLVESDSKEELSGWDRIKIQEQLEREAYLSPEIAVPISKEVENVAVELYQRGIRRIPTHMIREITDVFLLKYGLEPQKRKQEILGMPINDLEKLIKEKTKENANVASNNPEALNLAIAENTLKQLALGNLFSEEVAEAHMQGRIHLHDLGYPTRVYCSSHSLEYLKKYGLNKLFANLESKSSSPNHAETLSQHLQTAFASLQAFYAGALGVGYLNIFYSPLLNAPTTLVKGKLDGKDVEITEESLEELVSQGIDFKEEKRIVKLKEASYKEMLQVAQNLNFAASQNAFSRGGQTLFIDFNVHTGVPSYLKRVPAIGPKGKYMVENSNGEIELVDEIPRFNNLDNPKDQRNGDALDFDGKKTIVYGDERLEKTSQKFAKAMLEIWRRGDKDGRPFHFPKCDFHVDEKSFSEPAQREVFDFACDVASENGSVYFMFDRGGAVLAQCCRLKEKITDMELLKYPERLRFCGFQNVTINLPQAAYRARGNSLEEKVELLFKEINKVMDIAVKAHLEKKKSIQSLLDNEGSVLRPLGVPSDDGKPYLDLDKATYIIGLIGLNETVQTLTGKQLHEDEEAYRLGLLIASHASNRASGYSEKYRLKFALEESPAESAARRLAKIDVKNFKKAREVVKGSIENDDVYYTNSIHLNAGADVSMLDRIVAQSKFHDLIESGSIIHAYVGEERPDSKSIGSLVEKSYRNTRATQLVDSPTYTECDECGRVIEGLVDVCPSKECKNSNPENENKTLYPVTRIVGYYSRLSNWNISQLRQFQDRLKAAKAYADFSSIGMNWLYKTETGDGKARIKVYGKPDCPVCHNAFDRVNDYIKKNNMAGIDVRFVDLTSDKGRAEAVYANIPLDIIPSMLLSYNGRERRVSVSYNEETGKLRPISAKDYVPFLREINRK